MKVTKPYGRTFTIEKNRRIKIKKNRKNEKYLGKDDHSKNISNFILNHPPALIAQWISQIDKVIPKTKQDQKPTKLQFNSRDKLGKECWNLLKQRLPKEEHEYLEEVWKSKLHPYVTGKGFVNESNFKGSAWFKSFSSTLLADLTDKDFNQLALNIEKHLHENQKKINGQHRFISEPKGLIQVRAESIEKNVLKQIKSINDRKWTDADIEKFISMGDIAREIYTQNSKKKIHFRTIGKIIFNHYNKQFTNEEGICPSRVEISKTNLGLLHIYDAVKLFYKKTIKKSNKSSYSKILPKNYLELFKKIDHKSKNADVNALIRLGRVIHYEAAKLNEQFPEKIIEGQNGHVVLLANSKEESNSWDPNTLNSSNYWESEGQAEIKRTEAFVRFWRNVLSHAGRTLKALADPSDQSLDLIGDDQSAIKATTKLWDSEEARRKLALIFGGQKDLFKSETKDVSEFIYEFISITRQIRNQAFHFKNRSAFVKSLRSENEDFANYIQENDEIFKPIRDLYDQDQKKLINRVYQECEGAKLNEYAGINQLNSYLDLLKNTTTSDVTLPKFNRVLLRLERTKQNKGKGQNQELPAAGKKVDLENPALLAKHKGFKLIYEGPFKNWLMNKTASELNDYIKKSIDLGTKQAKNINKNNKHNEIILAKAAAMELLEEGQNIQTFMNNLTAETASEMRVQNGYESDANKAKSQADWIDKFRCDVVGQAFHDFANEAKLDWLYKINERTKPIANIAPMPTPNHSENSTPKDEQWLANLYLFFHFVPVEEMVRLNHQFSKWAALEKKSDIESQESDDIKSIRDTIYLYIKMHDDKFDGEDMGIGLESFKKLYELEADFENLYLDPQNPNSEKMAGTRRGLREIMRYGHLPIFESFSDKLKISNDDVKSVESMEKLKNGLSKISDRQKRRTKLHKQATSGKGLDAQEFEEYRNCIKTIVDHKSTSAHVKLLNHVKLHRLLTRIIARLIDFSGLWERDLLFITLALAKIEKVPLNALFENRDVRANFRKHGRVEVDKISKAGIRCLIEKYHTAELAKIRNNFAHFNMLQSDKPSVALTEQVNFARQLMAYDRKLKNAVAKSIIDIMYEEGFELSWKMNDNHQLSDAKISSRPIEHLRTQINKFNKGGQKNIKYIYENFHDERYLTMVKQFFS